MAKQKANKKVTRKPPAPAPSAQQGQKPPAAAARPKPQHRQVSPESRGVLLLDPSVRLPRVSLDEFKKPFPYRLAGGKLRGRDKKPPEQKNEPRRADDP